MLVGAGVGVVGGGCGGSFWIVVVVVVVVLVAIYKNTRVASRGTTRDRKRKRRACVGGGDGVAAPGRPVKTNRVARLLARGFSHGPAFVCLRIHQPIDSPATYTTEVVCVPSISCAPDASAAPAAPAADQPPSDGQGHRLTDSLRDGATEGATDRSGKRLRRISTISR